MTTALTPEQRIAELEAYLKKANSQTEHFEREWYLRGDRIEALEAELAAVKKDAQRPTVDEVMEQAQVFASAWAWALVGSRFVSGSGLEEAEQEKRELRTAVEAIAAPVAAQPTELEELRKLVKNFPLNDRDVPIIYNTNEIDLITYALTGDDGEDDSVTVLQRLVRALPGKTVYALLEDAEMAAQPQQAKPLTNEQIGAILEDPNIAEKHQGNWLVLPYAYARAIEAAHGIKEQG